MNILPKKNWHVRKKENIARVRKDEAEAAEKEKEKERRAKLAEQEARVSFLRKRARERDGINLDDDDIPSTTANSDDGESKILADIFTPEGNINFFKEAEAGLAETGTNKQHEEEKKAEKEDYEKKIGLLTYLGQDTLEAQGKTAWFNEREHIISKRSLDPSQENEIGLKSKSKLDPLNDIKKYTNFSTYPKLDDAVRCSSETTCKVKSKNLCRKDKKHKKERMKKSKRKRSSSTDSEHEPKKRKKKKHSKKKKRRELHEEQRDDKASSHQNLVKLREERLKREAYERKRAERLLAGKDPDVEEKDNTKSALPFIQKYNSQFNPHLAKQNQEILKVQPTTLQAGVKYWLN